MILWMLKPLRYIKYWQKHIKLISNQDYTGNSSLGTGKVVYGHIKGAINIPLEMLQRTSTNGSSTWVPLDEQAKMLIKMGLNPRRPVIVYDSTSVRSSAVWFTLKRLNYDAGIYFGSWPEWIIKVANNNENSIRINDK